MREEEGGKRERENGRRILSLLSFSLGPLLAGMAWWHGSMEDQERRRAAQLMPMPREKKRNFLGVKFDHLDFLKIFFFVKLSVVFAVYQNICQTFFRISYGIVAESPDESLLASLFFLHYPEHQNGWGEAKSERGEKGGKGKALVVVRQKKNSE